MSKSLGTIRFAIGGLIGLLVFAAIALFLFLDVNVLKPRFEAAVSEVLGMEVKVRGSLGAGFFPDLHVTLKDVHNEPGPASDNPRPFPSRTPRSGL